MTQKEMINLNKNAKKIFELINENNFSKAKEIFNTIEGINNNKISWIEKYIKEYEYYHSIKNTEIGKIIFEYLRLGNLSLYYEDYYTALQYFMAGSYLTKDPLFQYYIGVCYFYMGEHKGSLTSLSNYSLKHYLKQEESHFYISEIYKNMASDEYIDDKRYSILVSKEEYHVSKYNKIKKIKNGCIFTIKKHTKNIIFEDNEIKELISKGKINDVINMFNITMYKRKVTILALLYKGGKADTADRLLKKHREEIKKECPNELTALNNNKTLFMKQAKFGSN